MSILTSKEGNISVFRIGILAAILGATFIIGGYVLVLIDQSSRNSPLFIDRPEGAVQWGNIRQVSTTSQQVIYQVPGGDANAIANFYQEQINRHYGQSPNDPRPEERCIRTPVEGNFTAQEGYETGNGKVPFFWRCVFDNSVAGGLFTGGKTQFTTVTIQPGVLNNTVEPPEDTTGIIFIIYDQVWSR